MNKRLLLFFINQTLRIYHAILSFLSSPPGHLLPNIAVKCLSIRSLSRTLAASPPHRRTLRILPYMSDAVSIHFMFLLNVLPI